MIGSSSNEYLNLTFSHDDIRRLLLELLDERDADGGRGGQDVSHVAEELGGRGRAGNEEAEERRRNVQEVGLKSRDSTIIIKSRLE